MFSRDGYSQFEHLVGIVPSDVGGGYVLYRGTTASLGYLFDNVLRRFVSLRFSDRITLGRCRCRGLS
jgi:hypothetical protein